MEKTKIIVIRDYCNQGKTTTMWLLLKAMREDCAKVKEFYDFNNDRYCDVPEIIPPVGELEKIDFWAVLEWHDLIVVLNSRGDYVRNTTSDAREALREHNPDFIVCALQNRDGNNNIWNNFNWYFPNTKYERICFWVEHAENEEYKLIVKQPTVEAIMKYMN